MSIGQSGILSGDSLKIEIVEKVPSCHCQEGEARRSNLMDGIASGARRPRNDSGKVLQRFQIFFLICCFCVLVTLTGCEAFVRKFTRKPKAARVPPVEMVLIPEVYVAPQTSKQDRYQEYFLFWKSWTEELIQALSVDGSHKRQVNSAEEALKNLLSLKAMLNPLAGDKLEGHVFDFTVLKDNISSDVYNNKVAANRLSAERIKNNILRDFPYRKVKDLLI